VSKGHTEETPVTYKGEWADGKKSGIGRQVYAEGVYYGYWENDLRHGEGVMTYKNSDVYSGNWAKGEKEGKGTYVFEKTGQKYVGLFLQGQMVSGKWIYPNGTSFQGSFDNNKPKGQGVWTFENGNTVQGSYRQTRRVEDSANDIKIVWTTKV
jgi:radial spoke head protein 1